MENADIEPIVPMEDAQGIPSSKGGGQVPAQGKLSWWFSRRSRSQNPDTPRGISPSIAATHANCHFFDCHGTGAYATEIAGFSTSLWHAVDATGAMASAAVFSLELPACLKCTCSEAALVNVATVSLPGSESRLTVAMPISVLLPDTPQLSSMSKERHLEIARSARIAVDADLATLNAYLLFLGSLHARPRVITSTVCAIGAPAIDGNRNCST